MKGPMTTLVNPETQDEKDFAFDYSYWSHDGFETDDTGYNESVPGSSAFGAAAWPKKWPGVWDRKSLLSSGRGGARVGVAG